MKNWLLAAGACCVAIGLFALADRAYTTFLMGAPQAVKLHCRIPHPTRHHALRPNCAEQMAWGNQSFPFASNSLGFRDREVREVPPNALRRRILLLGDSFTEGMVRWNESIAGYLEQGLPDAEILNGAVQSYSPSIYYVVAKETLAAGIHIDEVVVLMDISDIHDEASLYKDGADGAVTTHFPIELASIGYPGSHEWLHRRMVLTYTLVTLAKRALMGFGWAPTVWGGVDIFNMPRSAWTYQSNLDAQPFPYGYAPLGVAAGIDRAIDKMNRLAGLLAQRGIPLSVAVYPWPAQLVHDVVNSRQVQIWSTWCAGKCRHFINVFPPIFAVRDGCPSFYGRCWYNALFTLGDVHFNANGNRLIAETVLRALNETAR